MVTSLELYEALKPTVGEEAAKMIAEGLPMSDRVATKSDIGVAISELELRLDARLSAMEARIYRWMLGFFATLWVSNAGVIVTLLLKS